MLTHEDESADVIFIWVQRMRNKAMQIMIMNLVGVIFSIRSLIWIHSMHISYVEECMTQVVFFWLYAKHHDYSCLSNKVWKQD